MASTNKKSVNKTSSKNVARKSGAKSTAKTASKNTVSKSAGTTRKKQTASKTSSGKNARSKAAMERKAREEELARQKQMHSEIALIVLFAFSVFLLLANFRICGIVGDTVSGFFFGVIGFAEYIFPVYLFVSAAYLISNNFNRKIVKKAIYFGVVLVLLSMVFQAIYSSDFESVKVLYMDGYTNHAGGGVLCGGIFFGIRTLLGVPGACIIMFIMAVIMFILITEISVVDWIKDVMQSIRDRRSYDDNEYDDGYNAEYYDGDTYGDDYDDVYRDSKSGNERAGHKKISEHTDDERKARSSMSSLNVYNTKNGKNDKNGKTEADKPKDFFLEDVHEIKADGAGSIYGDVIPYESFNNDVEKIVMTNDDEYINPVQVDEVSRTSGNSRKETVKSTGKTRVRPVKPLEKTLLSTVDEKIEETAVTKLDNVGTGLSAQDIDAGCEEQEDVLAGAVNGNMHPESVSDYNPMYDSAFVEEEQNGKTAQTKGKTDSNEVSRQYQANKKYRFPTAALLSQPPKNNNSNRDAHVRETAIKLKNTLETFGVNVTITNYSCGPAVTRFEMQPEQGVKVSKILNLADDIKLNLAAADIRIEAPIPGKAAIGIEVPNKENSIVAFRELIESDNFKNLKSKVAFAVGKDISGQVIATDIAKMPHLLIAGATGSGKSVCINTLIMSILYKATPEEVKLIMIDPKMVELACYNGIPHLLIPVVTDPKKAAGALNWAVMEMTKRYQLFAEHSVRNIQGYNDKVENAVIAGADGEKLTKMPQIVVIVDELADLMMVAHGEVEDAIVRLSQLARAAGIHLVIATQRPSVDVITGLIKANVPSRIAFAVSSGVDSRTILDMVGAEKLLGKGDMLFYPTGYPKPVRVQGAFVSDDEVTAVVDFLKNSNGVGTYDDEVAKSISGSGASGATAIGGASASDKDEYFVEAGRFIIEKEKASIGMLQRTFKIGFNRAARIMDQLMAAGVVGPEEGTKARKILMTQEQFDEYIDTNL